MLEYTRAKGIVPNYTTNGRGLSAAVLRATESNCGAVAVSVYEPYIEAATAIETLTGSGIKTNVHFILEAFSIDTAIEWLKAPPEFLRKVNALIFLNYKPSGRKVFEERMLRNSSRLDEFFALATAPSAKQKVGFNACCVSGLFARTSASNTLVNAGDAGRLSLYVAEDMRVYPCSFQAAVAKGDLLNENMNLKDI